MPMLVWIVRLLGSTQEAASFFGLVVLVNWIPKLYTVHPITGFLIGIAVAVFRWLGARSCVPQGNKLGRG